VKVNTAPIVNKDDKGIFRKIKLKIVRTIFADFVVKGIPH
jgi:hypothetical protein